MRKQLFSLIFVTAQCELDSLWNLLKTMLLSLSFALMHKRTPTSTVHSWESGLPWSTVRLASTKTRRLLCTVNQDLARNKEQIHSQYSWCFRSTSVPRLEMDYLIVLLISYWKTTLRINSFQYVSMYGKIWRVMTFLHSNLFDAWTNFVRDPNTPTQTNEKTF